MDTFKLRLKVGLHEFEAEGPKDDVQAQFEAWKKLITAAPVALTEPVPNAVVAKFGADVMKATDPTLSLFETDGTTITLRAYPNGEQADDAVLLVAYGFKRLLNIEILSSVLLAKSLRVSGGTIDRLDRVVNNQISRGFMMKAGGIARGTKYRLTITGAAKADALAKELLEKLS